MSVTITDIRTILTAPAGVPLIAVKMLTSDDGLYGVGCATFTQRFKAVREAIDLHVGPFCIGRNVDEIEQLWQMSMVNGSWRNGPVLNNAISGIDQALWDIKGKRANMPVYQLLGGKCREGATVYTHTGGRDPLEVEDSVRQAMAEGYRCVRVALWGQGYNLPKPENAPPGGYWDAKASMRGTLKMLEHLRASIGFEIDLVYDVHERYAPQDAVAFAKEVEPFKLYFLEDPLAPEDLGWFKNIRQQSATPIGMGELFTTPHEWLPLVKDREVDFLRMHVSMMGGLTPARHVAAYANMYGVRTAWHGPRDITPSGHAANLHLDLSAPNFGVQECYPIPDEYYEIFPGTPEIRNGYMYANDQPGLGVDIDEAEAAKYPCEIDAKPNNVPRAPDGTPIRP
jgi:mannonate dehydratase